MRKKMKRFKDYEVKYSKCTKNNGEVCYYRIRGRGCYCPGECIKIETPKEEKIEKDDPDVPKKIESNTFSWYNRENDEIMDEYLRQWKKKYRRKKGSGEFYLDGYGY